jgi:hypothetical protein
MILPYSIVIVRDLQKLYNPTKCTFFEGDLLAIPQEVQAVMRQALKNQD